MRSLLLALAACGGGSSREPDAKIFFDDTRPDVPVLCTVQLNLGTQNLISTMPRDMIDTDRTGALAGRTVLTVAGRLPSSTAALVDWLVVDYVKPTTGDFQLNTAVAFDPDPEAAPYVAAAYLFGDVYEDATNQMVVSQWFWAMSGSLTLTAVGETSGAAIKGTVTQTQFLEIDDTNNLVAGGCTTDLQGMTIDAVHDGMNFAGIATALQPPTRAEWAALSELMRRRR